MMSAQIDAMVSCGKDLGPVNTRAYLVGVSFRGCSS
jgi:hypothetical protein